MTIAIISSAWQKYNQIEKEDFTNKIMYAISMVELLDDFNQCDYEKLIWLRDNTHEKIKESIYILDRKVDPTKGVYSNKRFVIKGIEYSQDRLQYYLCIAIEEVTSILFRNLKGFNIDMKLFDTKDDEVEIDW